MNQQEINETVSEMVFMNGIPIYEFKRTNRYARCDRCGQKIDKRDVRLRIQQEYQPILLCTNAGGCTEWFFKELLKRKGVV